MMKRAYETRNVLQVSRLTSLFRKLFKETSLLSFLFFFFFFLFQSIILDSQSIEIIHFVLDNMLNIPKWQLQKAHLQVAPGVKTFRKWRKENTCSDWFKIVFLWSVFTHVSRSHANILEQKNVCIRKELNVHVPTWLPFHCFGTPICLP